jgi:hypothetical protein
LLFRANAYHHAITLIPNRKELAPASAMRMTSALKCGELHTL